MHTQQQPLTLSQQNATDAGDFALSLVILSVVCVGFIRDGWRRNKAKRDRALEAEITKWRAA